jgi:hypothetical protein
MTEVIVYVRRPGRETGTTAEEGRTLRTISFEIPRQVTHAEILAHDYAIDGTRAFAEFPRSDLHQRELDLIAWMRGYGIDVRFA